MAYVYILTSARNGTLYVGVTNDLIARVYQHKKDFVDSFTSKYKIHQLVWFEQVDSIISAIQREKQIKAWKREWEIRLIEETNPYWRDLYLDII
ncbi:GIY-YIG nuclease family protein [Undibacterium sp. TJN19]|uniref:GIY-YIG nuclease family protein n=1 Tax=Undibacterium sp. TJN19 TaxID=3413055 RepID=UPI003BF1DB1F